MEQRFKRFDVSHFKQLIILLSAVYYPEIIWGN